MGREIFIDKETVLQNLVSMELEVLDKEENIANAIIDHSAPQLTELLRLVQNTSTQFKDSVLRVNAVVDAIAIEMDRIDQELGIEIEQYTPVENQGPHVL